MVELRHRFGIPTANSREERRSTNRDPRRRPELPAYPPSGVAPIPCCKKVRIISACPLKCTGQRVRTGSRIVPEIVAARWNEQCSNGRRCLDRAAPRAARGKQAILRSPAGEGWLSHRMRNPREAQQLLDFVDDCHSRPATPSQQAVSGQRDIATTARAQRRRDVECGALAGDAFVHDHLDRPLRPKLAWPYPSFPSRNSTQSRASLSKKVTS